MVWRFLSTGGVEGLIGFLWLVASLVSLGGGRVPPLPFAIDAIAFGCLLVTLRWLKIGTVMMLTVTMASVVLDPDGRGVSLYIALCALTTLVRVGRIRLALPFTVLSCGAVLMTSFRRADQDEGLAVLLSSAFLGIFAWTLGLTFQAVRRTEEQRAARVLQNRNLEIAADMHDFVGRELTNLIMHAEAACARGETGPQVLQELADRARLANRALRQVTHSLRQGVRETSGTGFAKALETGLRELTEQGFDVRSTVDVSLPLDSAFREETDLALGRIIQETLHNIAKHGDRSTVVALAIEQSSTSLDITISNQIPRNATPGDESGMGLEAVCLQSELLGGEATFHQAADTWLCSVCLPLRSLGYQR